MDEPDMEDEDAERVVWRTMGAVDIEAKTNMEMVVGCTMGAPDAKADDAERVVGRIREAVDTETKGMELWSRGL